MSPDLPLIRAWIDSARVLESIPLTLRDFGCFPATLPPPKWVKRPGRRAAPLPAVSPAYREKDSDRDRGRTPTDARAFTPLAATRRAAELLTGIGGRPFPGGRAMFTAQRLRRSRTNRLMSC